MSRISMQGPGSQNNPDGLSGDLASRLRGTDSRIGKIERGAPLSAAGIHVSPEGMTIDSELHVTGDTVIDGTLSLPAGIINNEALASPVKPGQVGVTTTNFGMSTTATAKSASSIEVPDGFTSALILATAHVAALNSTGVGEFLYVGAQIGSVTPAYIPHPVAAGSWVAGSGTASRIIPGLTGGSTIAIAAMAKSNAGTWSASASAIATIDAIVQFFR